MQEVCLSLINLEGADGKVEVKEKKQNQREVIIIDKEELYLKSCTAPCALTWSKCQGSGP